MEKATMHCDFEILNQLASKSAESHNKATTSSATQQIKSNNRVKATTKPQ